MIEKKQSLLAILKVIVLAKVNKLSCPTFICNVVNYIGHPSEVHFLSKSRHFEKKKIDLMICQQLFV